MLCQLAAACDSHVARRETQRERRAASDLALDRDRAVELFDDPLRDRQAETEAAPLGGDEVVEDRRQPVGRNARSGVGDGTSTRSPARGGRDRDPAARLGRLNGVGDEIAEDASEREAIAVDGERPVGVARLDRDAGALAFGAHRVDDLRDRPRSRRSGTARSASA